MDGVADRAHARSINTCYILLTVTRWRHLMPPNCYC